MAPALLRAATSLAATVLALSASIVRASSLLYVGGEFTMAGDVQVNSVAAWDGAEWSPLASGMDGGGVDSLIYYDGALIAGGGFRTAGGVAASRIARWDGAAWAPLGPGLSNYVVALATYQGDLIAGGHFTGTGTNSSAGLEHIARWDGAAWSPVAGGSLATVYALAVYDGHIIAGGSFLTSGGATIPYLGQSDGTAWFPLGTGVSGMVNDFVVYNGALVVGGYFDTAGGVPANHIAQWDGVAWTAFGVGFDAIFVAAVAVFNGDLVAGGDMVASGSTAVQNVARWNATASEWTAIGTGVGFGYPDSVIALANYQGRLIAGGDFSFAGDVPVNRLAQWDGVSWQPLGPGVNFYLYAILGDDGATPTPPPPTTTATPPPGGCSLSSFEWHAQYYTAGDVLVEDDIAFDGTTGTFHQNTTAFPFQQCVVNWVDWRGDYEQTNATTVLLSYIRCTQSGVGCIACGPTADEWVGVSFSEDCETLALKHADGDVRTYFPARTS